MAEMSEQRQGHPGPEYPDKMLLLIDVEVDPEAHPDLLPIAQVLEEIRQALSVVGGVEPLMVHASIRETRDEMLNAFAALEDEENRRG